MRLAYLLLLDLDSGRAHVLQTVHTAVELARLGHRVRLQPRSPPGRDPADLLRRLVGTELPRGLHLDPVSAPRDDLARARLVLGWLPRIAARSPDELMYARERRVLMPLLHLRRVLRSPLPLVYEFHNLEHRTVEGPPNRLRRIRRQERRIARAADGIVATTEALARDLEGAFSPTCPVCVIPSGASVEDFRGVGSPDLDGAVEVVYAGSLFREKGVDLLVRAVALLPDRVGLTVVGGNTPDDLERLKALAGEVGVASRVRFVGQVPAPDVPGWIGRADLLAIPAGESLHSQRYTSPLKLFESMATGVPLVVGPSPAFLEVVEDGRTALVAADSSAEALARTIERALSAPGRALEAARTAMAEAEAYSWSSRARKVERFLRDLDRGGGGRRGGA